MAASVREILSRPVKDLDYIGAKLALDAMVAPSLNAEATRDEISRLAQAARRLTHQGWTDGERLGAIRQVIYEDGSWNGHRPFAYDHSDPLGTSIAGKLLGNYLLTRRGQCVSMPILFLVLAEQLGVGLTLATAPHHVFLRYRAPGGHVINIETTSGGHPARDEWFRRNFTISDRALETGLYMRTLTRRESVAVMATTIFDYLFQARRYREAIAVAQAILDHNPRDGQVIAAQAATYGALIQAEFADRYPTPWLIPEALRPRYRLLCERNRMLFAAAEAMGWEPDPSFERPPIQFDWDRRKIAVAK